jgi:hypothetical protein
MLGASSTFLEPLTGSTLMKILPGLRVMNEMLALGGAQHVSLRFGLSFHFTLLETSK